MKPRIVRHIDEIAEDVWNALVGDDPFQRHAFLHGLELCGCVGPGTGWAPSYIVLEDATEIVGVAAAYIKTHSMGEYVYDFQWARAAQMHGIPYYPKLVVTSPFSPVEGTKLHAKNDEARRVLAQSIPHLAEALGCVGAHVLFAHSYECELMEGFGAMTRVSHQFHWENEAYASFDDYLGALRSRRRKEIRRERRAVHKAGIDVRVLEGSKISLELASDIFEFYDRTHAEYGWTGYLNERFFSDLLKNMPESIVFFGAYRGDELIAGAFCLRDAERLYGRYWGTREDISQLHFETALYAPIEWAIREGVRVIEPGAGGQHKFRRGFMPRRTYSSHWHVAPSFHEALQSFCAREARAIDTHIEELIRTSTPFRRDA